MSKVVEQMGVNISPLDAVHKARGAVMGEQDGWQLPAHYGDVLAEYEAVRGSGGGAGLIDLSFRGLIELSGSEVVAFLNGLVTNDVKALADGAWMLAAFPNLQGRLVAAVRIMRYRDLIYIETDPTTHARVLQNVQRFTLAGDFRVRDLANDVVLVSVQGAAAAKYVASVLGSQQAAKVARDQVLGVARNDQEILVIRATHTAEDGFDLFVPVREVEALWEEFANAGACPTGHEALEILRVEAGLARYGVDIDETTVVLEAGIDEAVSYTKGCYLGQEIIARIHWRGHVARRLSGIIVEEAKSPIAKGTHVKSTEGKDLARATSSVYSPQLNKVIALGLVKYDFLQPGTNLTLIAEEAPLPALVAKLPFVRGSW